MAGTANRVRVGKPVLMGLGAALSVLLERRQTRIKVDAKVVQEERQVVKVGQVVRRARRGSTTGAINVIPVRVEKQVIQVVSDPGIVSHVPRDNMRVAMIVTSVMGERQVMKVRQVVRRARRGSTTGAINVIPVRVEKQVIQVVSDPGIVSHVPRENMRVAMIVTSVMGERQVMKVRQVVRRARLGSTTGAMNVTPVQVEKQVLQVVSDPGIVSHVPRENMRVAMIVTSVMGERQVMKVRQVVRRARRGSTTGAINVIPVQVEKQVLQVVSDPGIVSHVPRENMSVAMIVTPVMVERQVIKVRQVARRARLGGTRFRISIALDVKVEKQVAKHGQAVLRALRGNMRVTTVVMTVIMERRATKGILAVLPVLLGSMRVGIQRAAVALRVKQANVAPTVRETAKSVLRASALTEIRAVAILVRMAKLVRRGGRAARSARRGNSNIKTQSVNHALPARLVIVENLLARNAPLGNLRAAIRSANLVIRGKLLLQAQQHAVNAPLESLRVDIRNARLAQLAKPVIAGVHLAINAQLGNPSVDTRGAKNVPPEKLALRVGEPVRNAQLGNMRAGIRSVRIVPPVRQVSKARIQ
eukprot:gb/GECG01005417.1/.p1 GENE.gb/GECG01005417.1/~~gb/GECG01005417.1/.p1  ORF type:complete len:587 (+),score=46.40 gb/GECG01005417.1/:1-1761(+)